MAAKRWVVLVKPPDDHPGAVRLSGPYTRRDLAKGVVDQVQSAINAQLDVGNETEGYAYLIELEKFGTREALAYALEGKRGR